MFAVLFIVLAMALLQSRLLIQILRTRGESDALLSTYRAESAMNDRIARLSLGDAFPDGQHEITRADGTKLTTESHTDGNLEIMSITARLPFASTKLELTRTVSQIAGQLGGLDIIFSLDCTGSMNECADQDYDNCQSAGSVNPTRLEALRDAVVDFLEDISSIQSVPIRIGVSVFGIDANWLTRADGRAISPDQNVPIAEIIDRVTYSFQKRKQNSPACQKVSEGGTTQGSGLRFMHEYFASHANPDVKQVEILISDGLPTAAVPNASCGLDYLVPYSQSNANTLCPQMHPAHNPLETWQCLPLSGGGYAYRNSDPSYPAEEKSRTLFSCMIADTNTQWEGTNFGRRDPDVDTHVLLTFTLPSSDPIKTVYSTYPGVAVYDMEDATNLSETLKDSVLTNIEAVIESLKIRRVIP